MAYFLLIYTSAVWITTLLFLTVSWLICRKQSVVLNAPFLEKNFFSTEYVYVVTIVTGLRPWAGTDADIYIRLYGANSTSELFKIDDCAKGHFRRGAIDRFLIFTPEKLGNVCRVELQMNAQGRTCDDWFLSEVIVQDVEDDYNCYIFICRQWLKAGCSLYKHFLVGPRCERDPCSQTFISSFLRGLPQYHLWLSVFNCCSDGRAFTHLFVGVALFQLQSNLMMVNIVPAVIPDHVHLLHLVDYQWPFNLVCFIMLTIIEAFARNIRPLRACGCPYHHSFDVRAAAIERAVQLEVAVRPQNLDLNPTYLSLLQCFTENEWDRCRRVARSAWHKTKGDGVPDEVLDDVIRTFIYRAAQKIHTNVALEDELLKAHRPSNPGNNSLRDPTGTGQTPHESNCNNVVQRIIDDMPEDIEKMLRERACLEGGAPIKKRSVAMKGSGTSRARPSRHKRRGRGRNHNANNPDGGEYYSSGDSDEEGGGGDSDEYSGDEDPLVSQGPKINKRPSAISRTGSRVPKENKEGGQSNLRSRSQAHQFKSPRDPIGHGLEATIAMDDTPGVIVYRVVGGKGRGGSSSKLATNDHMLFLSNLDFVIRYPDMESMALIVVHNKLTKAVAFEATPSNAVKYTVQSNVGLIKPQGCVHIAVFMKAGQTFVQYRMCSMHWRML